MADLRQRWNKKFRRCGRTWTASEIDYLIDKYGSISLNQMTRHLHRSEKAIRLKAKRIGINMKNARGNLTARQISDLCHVDVHTVTDYWCQLGLRYKILATRTRYKIRSISPNDFVAFLKKHPEAIDYMNLPYRNQIQLGLWNSDGTKMQLRCPPAGKLIHCHGNHTIDARNGKFLNQYRIDDPAIPKKQWRCGNSFWVEIYEMHPRCPQCGACCSHYATEFRGSSVQEMPPFETNFTVTTEMIYG